jgi:hypothetical protein
MTRLRDVLAAATLVVVVAGCGWMFPDDRDVPDGVTEMFDRVSERLAGECAVDPDRAVRIGAVQDPDVAERSFELYVAATDGGGEIQVVRQLDEDEAPIGGLALAGGCRELARGELSWAGGQASGLNQFHAGRVPDGATVAVLHLAGGDEVTVETIDGDYYFAVISDATWHEEIPQPDLIEALDEDGNVVGELRP